MDPSDWDRMEYREPVSLRDLELNIDTTPTPVYKTDEQLGPQPEAPLRDPFEERPYDGL